MENARLFEIPTQEELTGIISRAFPTWKRYDASLLKGGMFNTTYRLHSTDPVSKCDYVLRIGPRLRDIIMPYENYLMDAEDRVYALMHEKGIPTSYVVYKDTTKKFIDRDIIIFEFIPSIGLDKVQLSPEEESQMDRTLGSLARQMAEIHDEKFGRIAQRINGVGFDTWPEFIDWALADWAECMRSKAEGYFTEEEINNMVQLGVTMHDLFAEVKTPCLTHCDIWKPNVLLEPDGSNRVAAIIDTDRSTMGDPAFGLPFWTDNRDFCEGFGEDMEGTPSKHARSVFYRLYLTIHDAYFMWVQYDNHSYAMDYKKHAMELYNELLPLI